MMSLTCEGEYWIYFTCEEDPTSLKYWVVDLYILLSELSSQYHMILEKSEHHQVRMQVNSHYPWGRGFVSPNPRVSSGCVYTCGPLG